MLRLLDDILGQSWLWDCHSVTPSSLQVSWGFQLPRCVNTGTFHLKSLEHAVKIWEWGWPAVRGATEKPAALEAWGETAPLNTALRKPPYLKDISTSVLSACQVYFALATNISRHNPEKSMCPPCCCTLGFPDGTLPSINILLTWQQFLGDFCWILHFFVSVLKISKFCNMSFYKDCLIILSTLINSTIHYF